MKKHMLFTLLVVLPFPMIARAGTVCPWINKATVSGLLDSMVSLEMQSADGNGSTCFFQSRNQSSPLSLQVVVRNRDAGHEIVGYESQCGSYREPLRNIANDTVLCDIEAHSLRGVQVTGRVRNKIFAVRLESSRRENAGMTEKMLREKAKTAAEQVAGNLF